MVFVRGFILTSLVSKIELITDILLSFRWNTLRVTAKQAFDSRLSKLQDFTFTGKDNQPKNAINFSLRMCISSMDFLQTSA